MDMDLLAAKVSDLAGFVWNGLLLYLLVGTGLIFTIRTRFIQVRKFGHRLPPPLRQREPQR